MGKWLIFQSVSAEDGDLFVIALKSSMDWKLFVVSSTDDGGIFTPSLYTGSRDCLLRNESEGLKGVHGIYLLRKDGSIVTVDKVVKKVKVHGV